MKIVNFPNRRNRAQHLTRILDRRVAQDACWAKFRIAVVRLHDDPSPVRHVAAHDARRAWERTW